MPRADCTIDNLARDWAMLIDTLAPEGPLVLAGHSIGGMTMMALAEQRADLFDRVVGAAFVSTSSGALDTVTLGLPEAGELVRAQIPRMLALRSRTLSRRARRRAPIVETLVMRRFLFGHPMRLADSALAVEGLISCPGDTVVGYYEDCMAHERTAALKVLDDIPTHVLVGTRDVLTPPVAREADRRPRAGCGPDRGAGCRPHAAARARPAGLRRADPARPTARAVHPGHVTTRAAAVILAAGAGSRVGAAANKVLLPLGGMAMLAHSVRTVLDVAGVHRIVLVVRPEDRAAVRDAVAEHLGAHDLWVVDGGEQRHDSEWQALRALAADIERGEIDVVAIHDGARPLAPARLWEQVIDRRRGARRRDPGRPTSPGCRVATGRSRPRGSSASRPRRPSAPPSCWRPTGGPSRRASSAPTRPPASSGTPTSPSSGCPAPPANLKVTFPEDLALAESLLGRPTPPERPTSD